MFHRIAIATFVCLLLPLLGHAQPPELNLPSFTGLQHKASDSVDISLGSFALGILGWALDDHDPETADLKKTLQGLKAVHLRSYQFDSDFLYPEAQIDALRAQLSAPGWSRLVQVRDRNKHENVDVWIALEGHRIQGLALIANEPRGFTILNIVGSIDLEHVARVQKALGVPVTDVGPVAQPAR